MDVYIGRQPILNKQQKTVAYELLYREGAENKFPNIEPHEATSLLLHNLFTSLGLDRVSKKHPVFINFGREMLLSGLPNFSPRSIVVEILEDIEFDKELIEACQNINKVGFKIALDDFILEAVPASVISLASIIKIDWLRDSIDKIKYIIKKLEKFDLVLLAEKIETKEQFNQAKEMGFELFQGYFFAKPAIIKGKSLDTDELSKTQLLTLINKPDIELKELTQIIKKDLSLVYKLLKIINSANYALQRKISSVEEAVILLGLEELKKWLSIILISNVAPNKSKALINMALSRAIFCEKLACATGASTFISQAFLTGLLSLFHVILDCPLEIILKELPIDISIINAILYKKGILGLLLQMCEAYEIADEKQIISFSNELKITHSEIATCYLKALENADRYCELI